MRNLFFEKYDKFYFIGIGGVSMSGLAKFLLVNGKTVAGSDVCENIYTKELSALGVRVDISERRSVKDFDVIVYTDAIMDSDVQLIEAESLGKTILSRGQFLYEVSRLFDKVIAISGCHGKTTCTSMLAHIFECAGLNFCAHIGGKDKSFSNMYFTGYDFFLTEACEYKKNFLLLKPDIGVILNGDADHLECYGSKDKLRESYVHFAKSSDVSVTLYGEFPVNGITFGMDKNALIYARNIKLIDGKYSFDAFESNKMLGRVELCVYGKHNVLNALACIAVARTVGITFDKIREGLKRFDGAERRFEKIGNVNGAICIADYAHHPNEIRATIEAVKQITNGKLHVVFQPHTYSRTKNLFKDFVRILSKQSKLLIYKTFAAREYFDDSGSALTLSQSIRNARYGDEPKDIEEFISEANSGDIILILGAGDIYDIAKKVIADIGK